MKRMIHYLYLKINITKNTSKERAEEIVNSIGVKNYQRFYDEAV